MVEALRGFVHAPVPAVADRVAFAPQKERRSHQGAPSQPLRRGHALRPLGANTDLFAHAPRVTDIVQGPDRSCALHASAQAWLSRRPEALQQLLYDHHNGRVSVGLFEAPQDTAQPWRQVHQTLEKSVPTDLNGAAPWWRLVERAFAAGCGEAPATGAHCDAYLRAFSCGPAYRHFCDLRSAAYTLQVLLMRRQLGAWQVSCLGLGAGATASLEVFLTTHPGLPAALAATYCWQAPCSPTQLDALLAKQGLRDATLRAALCGAATRQAATQFLERCMLEKLRCGAAMCFATRPAGAPGGHRSLSARLVPLPADLWLSLRRRGYLALRLGGQIQNGLLCEHAYAVVGMRTDPHSGALQLQVREPLGKLGCRSLQCGHRHWEVAQTQATFWLPAAVVLQNAITLYFTV
jgi:hypothetical protein